MVRLSLRAFFFLTRSLHHPASRSPDTSLSSGLLLVLPSSEVLLLEAPLSRLLFSTLLPPLRLSICRSFRPDSAFSFVVSQASFFSLLSFDFLPGSIQRPIAAFFGYRA